MASSKGYLYHIMYIAETAYGTGATVTTAISGKVKDFSHEPNNNFYRTQGLGEGRNETFTGLGNYSCTWTMSVECGTSFFEFLQFLIGPKSGSGSTAAPYYLEEADQVGYTGTVIKSFEMEVGSEVGATDDTDTFNGCIINKATFNFALNKPLTCSLDGFTKKPTSSTASTAYTANTDKIWMFYQGNFKWGGTDVGRVQSGSITIDNTFNEEEERQMGDRFVQEPQPGLRKYDWSIVVKMNSTQATTLRDAHYGQANTPSTGVTDAEPTSYAVILDLSEGAASTDKKAQILISDNFIDRLSKPIDVGGGYVEMTVTGHGRKGTTDTVNKPMKWWTVT